MKYKTTINKLDDSYQDRALKCIAQGALTNSKRPECLVRGVYPTHLEKGKGCHVWDFKGNKYIDFICGLGTNLIGYGDDLITRAAYNSMVDGSCLSLSSTLEIKFAEKIKELFPSIELLRVLKTGSEAALASLRIARAYNGRDDVLSEGYHGQGDEFTSLHPPAHGILQHFSIKKFTTIDQINKSTSAVIIEPVSLNWGLDRIEYLRQIRQKCTEHNVVLIFDEIITGFRWPRYSVSNFYDIYPDLILLGKAMGNGFPIAIVGGKKTIMNCNEYFVSSTYAGERPSMAASLEVIKILNSKKRIDDLWDKGEKFYQVFNEYSRDTTIHLAGYPARGLFSGDDLERAYFFQEGIKAGLLFGPSWFFNFCHIDVMDEVLLTCRDIFYKIKHGMVKLEGQLPFKPFAQNVRETK